MSMETALISGGSGKIQLEPDYRRIINKIMTLALSEGYRDINIEKFRDVMRQQLNNQEVNSEEMLIAFDNLDTEKQIELIEQFCDTKPNIDLPTIVPIALADSFKEQEYIYRVPNVYDKLGDATLKKLIKYSKNPMEKKQLQKELSSRNFMCGKHSKGKRR